MKRINRLNFLKRSFEAKARAYAREGNIALAARYNYHAYHTGKIIHDATLGEVRPTRYDGLGRFLAKHVRGVEIEAPMPFLKYG